MVSLSYHDVDVSVHIDQTAVVMVINCFLSYYCSWAQGSGNTQWMWECIEPVNEVF